MRQNDCGILYGDALPLDDKRSGTKLFRRCRLKKQVPAFVNGPLDRMPQSFCRHRLSLPQANESPNRMWEQHILELLGGCPHMVEVLNCYLSSSSSIPRLMSECSISRAYFQVISMMSSMVSCPPFFMKRYMISS